MVIAFCAENSLGDDTENRDRPIAKKMHALQDNDAGLICASALATVIP